jgi:hypothetical protein
MPVINHYPDKKARRDKKPAGRVSVTKWADAPGGRTWALVDGLPRSSANTIAYTTYQGEAYFVGPLPEGTTYA